MGSQFGVVLGPVEQSTAMLHSFFSGSHGIQVYGRFTAEECVVGRVELVHAHDDFQCIDISLTSLGIIDKRAY